MYLSERPVTGFRQLSATENVVILSAAVIGHQSHVWNTTDCSQCRECTGRKAEGANSCGIDMLSTEPGGLDVIQCCLELLGRLMPFDAKACKLARWRQICCFK